MSNDYDLLRVFYRDRIKALETKINANKRDPKRNIWFAERKMLLRKLNAFKQEHQSIHPDTYGDW